VAIVVGLIALGAGWWYARRPVRPPALPLESIAMKRLTNTGDASVAAISPDGRYVVHVVGAHGKPSLWVRQVSSASNVQIVPAMPGSYGALTFSPDGENVLYVFYPPNTFGSLFELPLLGGLPRKIVEDLDTAPAFSPDGQRMAFVRDLGGGARAIVLATRDGGNQQRLAVGTTPNEYAPVQMAWSADGRELATFVGSMPRGLSRLVLVDVATGRPRDLSDARFDFPGQLSWLPEGRTLVFDAVGQGQGYGSSGQLWSISYPDGALRRLTADVANYSRLAAARDGRTFVAVQHAIRGNLWVAPEGDTSRARSITNITAGGDGTVGIDWTYDGRIVYGAMAHDSWDLWIANADGSAARQLTSAPGVEAVPCALPGGRSVAYISRSLGESRFRIRAVDLDGSNDRELLSTDVQPGYLQAVGDQLYFWVLPGRGVVAHRMPLAGGTPLPVFADPAKLPPNFRLRGVSPDGQWAFGTTFDLHVPGVNLAVLSIAGTRPRRIFPLPTERLPLDLVLSWAPRADAVEAVVSREGIGNLWRFPLDGSPPVPITRFESDDIRSYAWSHDGRTLALSRGSQSSDVVHITQGR
jgi:Tol biopolymer transport system component